MPERVPMLVNVAVVLAAGWAVAGTAIAQAAPGSNADWFLQYGALGLVALMILLQSRAQAAAATALAAKDAKIAQVLAEKDLRWERLFERAIESNAALTEAAKNMNAVAERCRHVQERG